MYVTELALKCNAAVRVFRQAVKLEREGFRGV